MRNAKAFQFKLFVDDKVGTEIQIEQFAVFRFDAIDGEWLAGLDERMRNLLKLGKHRLANDCAANGIDLAIDEVRPLLSSLAALHHVTAQQLFVERARHFGDKDGVLVRLKWLM